MRIERMSAPTHVQFTQRMTAVKVGGRDLTVDDLKDELLGYYDVLLGRAEPPIDSPYLQLAEVATAYYARGCEIDSMIHEAEREGTVMRGHDLYRFRTGALRSFLDAAKRMADLGSRRLTQEQLLAQQRRDSGELL